MNLESLIQACEWGDSRFLVFSENVFEALIYYSHLTPIVLSLVIGIFVFLKNRSSIVARTLFFITALFSVWTFFDLILWAHESPKYIMFFWSILILLEPVIYAACLYFLYVFVTKKAPSFSVHLFALIFLLPSIFLTPTDLSILGFNISNCDREVVEGALVYYGYIAEIIFTFWILGYAVFASRKYPAIRSQIVLVTTGVVLFLLAFSLGNIVGTFSDNWTIGQYGLFGMPVFVGFLAYLIVRFKAFNTKLIGTQALVVAIWILTLALLFIQHVEKIRQIVVVTLILFTFLGYQLVRSVKREIEAKEALARANQRLEELNKQKSEFVSFATHQLRAPLASMKGWTSLLLDGDAGTIPEKAKDVVTTIYKSARTMANVVEDYLNISRIELGTMKYTMDKMDFKDMVQEVVNEQRPNLIEKGLMLNVEIDASQAYMVSVDRDKFKQVVMNTIDNSAKYTPQGSVTVSLAKDQAKGVIRLKISDTGVGIDPKVMPLLFKKFSRAKDASATNIHGTGLGLFIAKEIMTGHGGRIWAESAGEGKGSQFYIELPEAK